MAMPGPDGPSPEHALDVVAELSDIDELGHVSNLTYVRWVQEAAKAHSVAVGWDHEAYRRTGAVFVVRRHVIEYLTPCFAGEAVRLVTWIATWSAASSLRRTRIHRAADARELARADTLWAFVSTESGRPTRIRREIVNAFAAPPPRRP
jgi:acyl-CoA thioester hydrolase